MKCRNILFAFAVMVSATVGLFPMEQTQQDEKKKNWLTTSFYQDNLHNYNQQIKAITHFKDKEENKEDEKYRKKCVFKGKAVEEAIRTINTKTSVFNPNYWPKYATFVLYATLTSLPLVVSRFFDVFGEDKISKVFFSTFAIFMSCLMTWPKAINYVESEVVFDSKNKLIWNKHGNNGNFTFHYESYMRDETKK